MNAITTLWRKRKNKPEGTHMGILAFINEHWLEWLFAGAVALLGWGYRQVYNRLKEEQQKNEAISMGVQALLRESIVGNYNKYSEKGHMPIYAKESVKKAYKAYADLGGNDVAKELYQKMLSMREAE